MLRNERYIGDCLYQKTYSDFCFKRHLNHGEQDQFYVTDHHEPIVSRELFEMAGQMLLQRAKEKGIIRRRGQYQNRYLFTRKSCAENAVLFLNGRVTDPV